MILNFYNGTAYKVDGFITFRSFYCSFYCISYAMS